MKTNISLIGFMGTGKSTIAGALAASLDKTLVEVDALIVLLAGKSVTRIFQEDGEITFRELEIGVIKEIAVKNDQVIDCGGGVVLNRINIDRLKQNGVIVWLTAPAEIILQRTAQAGNSRPLLAGIKDVSAIRRLMCVRQPFYEAAADVIIDTSAADIPVLVEQIKAGAKKYADFDSSR